MKAKLFPIVTLIFLAALLALAVPHKAEASCSGVDCGCDVDHATCIEGCEVWACYSACMKAYKECGIACCAGPGCPVVIPMGSDRQARFTDLAGGVLFDID